MSLFSLIAALLLEQYRSLQLRSQVFVLFTRYANFLERHLNAGERHHGFYAWLCAIVPVILVTGVIYFLLYRVHPIFAWLWNALVLYLTMGFRQFSHAFTEISEALRDGDIEVARNQLAKWRGKSSAELNSKEIARLAIEEGICGSYLYVFGVIVWFILLPGPTGAVLFRLAYILSQKWGERREIEFGSFGKFAAQVFAVLNWLPIRLTAISFAVVGDFEDAVYCWRAQAASWVNVEKGILLASGAGALGVRLGDSLPEAGGGIEYRPELGIGEEADVDFMQSTVGLIWRTLVLWLVLLLLLSVANWVG